MMIPVEHLGDVSVVAVPVEELDADNSAEFNQAVAPVLEPGAKVVLDVSRLRFLDSSGLCAFLICQRKLKAGGGALKLCGLSGAVRSVFEAVRMHKVFDTHRTREEAIRAFEQAA